MIFESWLYLSDKKGKAAEKGSIEKGGGSGVFNFDPIASKLDHEIGDKINENVD